MGLSCPECFEVGSFSLEEDCDRKNGLTSLLIITCECGYKKEAYTSHTVNKRASDETHNNACTKAYEINYRAMYDMPSLGKSSNVLRDAAKVIAEISMHNAVLELKHGHDVKTLLCIQ